MKIAKFSKNYCFVEDISRENLEKLVKVSLKLNFYDLIVYDKIGKDIWLKREYQNLELTRETKITSQDLIEELTREDKQREIIFTKDMFPLYYKVHHYDLFGKSFSKLYKFVKVVYL